MREQRRIKVRVRVIRMVRRGKTRCDMSVCEGLNWDWAE
jgi:hypothetical protein